MSVWKLAQSNLAGRRARFLIGVCGQCSTNSKDLLDPNNLVPRGQYNGYAKALLKKERLSLTPETPRFTARMLENPEDKVSPEEHETYRSGVGMLLYLTKHSRP